MNVQEWTACTYIAHVNHGHTAFPAEIVEECEGYGIDSTVLTVVCEVLLITRAILAPISGVTNQQIPVCEKEEESYTTN